MSSADRPAASLRARIALLVCSLLLVGAIAEIAARLAWNEPTRRPKRSGQRDLPRLKGLVDLARPGADGLHMGAHYRTNSNGIRGPEHAERAARGEFRLALTGDSVTMGWGVEEDEAYPARLEARLNADPIANARGREGEPIRHFSVLNFGLAGLNTASSIERLIKKAQIYQPQMAVYGFTINDIEGPRYRGGDDGGVNKVLAERYRAHRFSPSYLIRVLWPNWVALEEMILPTPGSLHVVQMENYFDNPPAWQDLEGGLERFARFGRAQGICTVLLLHTHLTQLGPFHAFHPIYDRVAEAGEAHGLPVIRSFDDFDGLSAPAYWVSYWDAHPNAAAHEVLAGALDSGLRALPSKCWSGAIAP